MSNCQAHVNGFGKVLFTSNSIPRESDTVFISAQILHPITLELLVLASLSFASLLTGLSSWEHDFDACSSLIPGVA